MNEKIKLKYPFKDLDIDWIKNGISHDAVVWCQSFGYRLADRNEIDFLNTRKKMKEAIKEVEESTLVEFKKKDGRSFTKDILSTTKLRKFFGLIRRVQADFEHSIDDVYLIRARLAYDVGRDTKSGRTASKVDEFYIQLAPALELIEEEQINKKKYFKNFINILEAIVAFHKEKTGGSN